MSDKQLSSNEVSVDEQAFERAEDTSVNEDGFEVVDEQPEFRATVEQEKQAKVDSNHPDGIVQDFSYLPLAQEEEIRAREAELKQISARAALSSQNGRARRTREVVTEMQNEKRMERTPDRTDPRERLSRMELAEVNREADRMARRLRTDHSRAAVSRALAKRVAKGQDITEAMFATMDRLKAAPGAICPIEDVPDVPTDEVSVEDTIQILWEPSSPNIEQVGLIADETGHTKFTSWVKSDPRIAREGEKVRMRAVKKNWHQERCSLAVTYDSMIVFPERDRRWWKE
ncbi:DNA-binding protein [Halobacteriales archaeon QS_4_69_225]|nr:MAG: DNA-binding protein [Halobacteriales archaeon QS_4_69_225]